jgi:hypothetical protein
LTNNQHGDQVGPTAKPLDPKLGKLKDNGGPTQTMALDKKSPAVDKGDNATCQSTGDAGVNNLDQRGVTRITVKDPTCDIGAFEFH